MRIIGIVTLALFMASGTVWAGPKATSGTLLGAASGAIIGSQIGSGDGRVAAIAVGTLAGAVVGNEVGRSLDRADQAAMYNNNQTALETSRTNYSTTWVNPDTGHSGSLTPTKTYQNSSGRYCREYQTTVTIGGHRQQAYGTACRQDDGHWQIAAPQQSVQVRQVTKVRYVEPRYVDYRYRDPYRYGYYPPFAGFFSIGYSKHSHGHKQHYSGHRYRGDHHKKIHHRKHRTRGSGHGYIRGGKHHRGHR